MCCAAPIFGNKTKRQIVGALLAGCEARVCDRPRIVCALVCMCCVAAGGGSFDVKTNVPLYCMCGFFFPLRLFSVRCSSNCKKNMFRAVFPNSSSSRCARVDFCQPICAHHMARPNTINSRPTAQHPSLMSSRLCVCARRSTKSQHSAVSHAPNLLMLKTQNTLRPFKIVCLLPANSRVLKCLWRR